MTLPTAISEIERRFAAAQATQAGANLKDIIDAVSKESRIEPDILTEAYLDHSFAGPC